MSLGSPTQPLRRSARSSVAIGSPLSNRNTSKNSLFGDSPLPHHRDPKDCPFTDCKARTVHRHGDDLQYYNPKLANQTQYRGYANASRNASVSSNAPSVGTDRRDLHESDGDSRSEKSDGEGMEVDYTQFLVDKEDNPGASSQDTPNHSATPLALSVREITPVDHDVAVEAPDAVSLQNQVDDQATTNPSVNGLTEDAPDASQAPMALLVKELTAVNQGQAFGTPEASNSPDLLSDHNITNPELTQASDFFNEDFDFRTFCQEDMLADTSLDEMLDDSRNFEPQDRLEATLPSEHPPRPYQDTTSLIDLTDSGGPQTNQFSSQPHQLNHPIPSSQYSTSYTTPTKPNPYSHSPQQQITLQRGIPEECQDPDDLRSLTRPLRFPRADDYVPDLPSNALREEASEDLRMSEADLWTWAWAWAWAGIDGVEFAG